MQNWVSSLCPANYDNKWYGNSMFPQIKIEPQTTISNTDNVSASPSSSPSRPLPIYTQPPSSEQQPLISLMDHFLNATNLQFQQQQQQQRNDMSSTLTPSPRTDSTEGAQYFDNFNKTNSNSLIHKQLHQHPLGFNPLTPPGLPNAILPQINFNNHDFTLESNQQQHQQRPSSSFGQLIHNQQDVTKLDTNNSLTPRNTPPINITPPKSPKNIKYNNSGNSEVVINNKDQEINSNSSDLVETEDEETIRMPRYNSHGKVKSHKCKSCGFVGLTKLAFWKHASAHMKPEKILKCEVCPFVTELKHHLEYHMRKHKNLKPFKCNQCNYRCVNKSMLNSHLKSHSLIFQYRCLDCEYATKYCHSFKLHLRKYDHEPSLVLDENGVPNPSIIIDVYGTRRGPKTKTGGSGRAGGSGRSKQSKVAAKASTSQQQQKQQQKKYQPKQQQQVIPPIENQSQQPQSNIPSFLPSPLASMLQQQHNMSQFFPYWNLNLQMLAAQQQAVLAQISPQMREAAIQSLTGNNTITNSIAGNGTDFKNFIGGDDYNQSHNNNDEDYGNDLDDRRSDSSSAMDLSSQGTPTTLHTSSQNEQIININSNDERTTPTISSTCNSRRKGRVLKLDTLLSHKISSIIKNNNIINLTDEIDCTTTGADKSNDNNEAPTSSSSSLTKIDGNEYNEDIVDTVNSNTNFSIALNDNSEPTTTSTHNSNSSNPQLSSDLLECKYCDIYFKNAILYTIHMGYHSCDDAFKCNMCGEKCDGPVGLFVHMARNAHS